MRKYFSYQSNWLIGEIKKKYENGLGDPFSTYRKCLVFVGDIKSYSLGYWTKLMADET